MGLLWPAGSLNHLTCGSLDWVLKVGWRWRWRLFGGASSWMLGGSGVNLSNQIYFFIVYYCESTSCTCTIAILSTHSHYDDNVIHSCGGHGKKKTQSN
jgi:hypothetical protein